MSLKRALILVLALAACTALGAVGWLVWRFVLPARGRPSEAGKPGAASNASNARPA